MQVKDAGFSLLELLVVTVILAVLASMLMLSAGLAGPQAKARNERRAMMHLINQHCEEAVLLGREGGVRLADDGYGFFWWDGEAWQVRDEKLFQPRSLEPPLELQLDLGDALAADPELPQIICDSAGEITPFSVAVVMEDVALGMRVNDDGQLVLSESDEPER